MYFEYTAQELNHLKNSDKNLKSFIDKIGTVKREVNPDLFESFIFQIAGQQISNKAYVTIKARIKELLTKITPENVLYYDDETLKSCGISFRKVSYMKNIATFWLDNQSYFKNINSYTDEEIIEKLTEIKGVGVWTVEMLLLFSLQRKNILSYNDLVIRNSLMKVHNLEKLDKKDFEIYKKMYNPYGSLASLYLWEINNL